MFSAVTVTLACDTQNCNICLVKRTPPAYGRNYTSTSRQTRTFSYLPRHAFSGLRFNVGILLNSLCSSSSSLSTFVFLSLTSCTSKQAHVGQQHGRCRAYRAQKIRAAGLGRLLRRLLAEEARGSCWCCRTRQCKTPETRCLAS